MPRDGPAPRGAPRHIELPKRKVFALRAALFDAIRHHAPDRDDALLDRLISDAKAFAEEEMGQPSNDVPLEAFLKAAVEAGEASVRDLAARLKRPVDAKLAAVLRALRRRVENPRCLRCAAAAGGAACDGSDEDQVLVAAGGDCILEIKDAFRQAFALARGLYTERGGPALAEPAVTLSTEYLAAPASLLPGRPLSLNARTSYDDESGAAKWSEVEVRTAALHLAGDCLGSLRYLLLHELLCHAFQMAASPGPRRNPKSIVDPLSEGWMDGLAADLIRRAAPPNGIEACDARKALGLHLDRADVDRSRPFPQAEHVAIGVDASALVFRLLEEKHKPGDPAKAFEDFLDISIALNADGWGYAERSIGLTNLVRKLGVRPRDQELAEAILAFRRGSDIKSVIEHLA